MYIYIYIYIIYYIHYIYYIYTYDDVFFIWTHGEEKLASFIDVLNNSHPNIKFTHESNKQHIPLLDLNVILSGNKLSTGLYIKPTDRHQYLHYTSSHTSILRNLLFIAKLGD